MELKVSITQRDVQRGLAQRGRPDAIDRAVQRAARRQGLQALSIDHLWITFVDSDGVRWQTPTPRLAKRWFQEYCEWKAFLATHNPMVPLQFTFDTVEGAHKEAR